MKTDMIAAIDLLRRARERLSNPERWHQGDFAAQIDGTPVRSNDPSAVAWCPMGAMVAETGGMWWGDTDVHSCAHVALQTELARQTGGSWLQIPAWADAPERTHEEILALFDGAIRELARVILK